MSLPEVLGAAHAIYGEQFSPMITLKTLTYFKDGNLESLPEEVKQALRTAAASVEDIPSFQASPGVVPA